MNEKEFKKIVALLRSNYPNFIVKEKAIFDFWYESLKDLDFNITQKAIMKIIMESEYAPTIATIRKNALQITGGSLTSGEALELIYKAVNKFGTYQTIKALEWIKNQNENTYKVVKSVGYRNICLSNPDFTRKILLKMYDDTAKNDLKLLPIKFADEIKAIQKNKFKMLEG